MQDPAQNQIEEQELTLREQLETYLRYWPWFVATVFVMLIGAYIYLRYTVPSYKVTATILIKDEKSNELSELAAFEDLGLGFSASEVENELEILRSKTLTERVVDNLNLTVRYFKEGNIRDAEVYVNRPFDLKVIADTEAKGVPAGFLYISPVSTTEYTLSMEGRQKEAYAFGKPINFQWGTIVVSPNLDILNENLDNSQLRVLIQNRDAVVGGLRNKISASQLSKNSNIVSLDLVSPLPERAKAILDELIQQYNVDAINDRNMVSRNTANFIQSRLEIITEELDSVETGKVEFKEANRLTDIAAEGQLFLENASELKKMQLEVETQIALVNTMEEYLEKGNTTDLLPANLGVEKEGFSAQVDKFNQLVLERNRLMQSSTPKNPLVVGLDDQINEMRQNIRSSLANVENGLQIQRRRLGGKEAQIGGEIAAIPGKEKQYRSISRQQEIKEALYLYLLQKREETAISLAVTTPKAKVVDSAYTQANPVSPKKQIILLAALILGLLIPFLIIYVRQLLDNKIRDRAYLERHGGDIPIIGEIPKVQKGDSDLIKHNDQSIMAEAYRIFRTNLQYLFINKLEKNEEGKSLIVTSTIKGEGKTFVAFNLALTLALTGKKVVLVGADIRNPQLQRYLPEHLKSKKGLTEYIVYEDLQVADVVAQSEYNENLNIIVSGAIPPNPAELLMQKRTSTLVEELRKQYDYIILDTAPAMLVTDTILINKLADITLYVVRADYTDRRLLDFAKDAIEDGRLTNVAMVLNNVALNNFGYGNKYGYAYSREERSLLKRILNKQ